MTPIQALVRLLADTAVDLGMGDHSFIVGGAPRDHIMGHEVKDLDVVVEPRNGKNAVTLANAVAKRLRCSTNPDKYMVCHIGPVKAADYRGVSLAGLKVEVVTSRKEKYDRSRGSESHKPIEVEPATIFDDLLRRDFTINTLAWSLGSLVDGIEKAPIIDRLRRGREDIENKILRTPLDPHETFDDDPSRMLRAIRFAVKYDFTIERETYAALQDRAEEIRRLPYEAIDPLFFDKILTLPREKVVLALAFMENSGLLQPVLEMIPPARTRRAIQERIQDVRLLLLLAHKGFDVGVKLPPKHLKRLRDAEAHLDDQALEAFFQRYRNPVNVNQLVAHTGIAGPAIGRAIERARDLMLLGFNDERVYSLLVEEVTQPTP